MIYLVTREQLLFQDSSYECISVEESLNIMNNWKLIQFDTETTGLDPHLCSILCIQFGNKDLDIQIVIDTTTINPLLYKKILETKYLIGQNLKFDLQFLYTLNITPNKVYDTMIVEQLLYLGYPHKGVIGGIDYGLAAIAKRYLDINIDKSIRGDIIWRGLDTDVIVYAANDVKWLEDIMYEQLKVCKSKNCLIGAKLECDFVPVISYLEWCGIILDEDRWKAKMKKDRDNLKQRTECLDKLAISWGNESFYTINRQGDLWEGFDLEPKCNINWSSSRQVIQVAKYLGFDTNIKDKKTGESKESVVEKHLKGQKGINDEFIKAYFEYQESSKVCSTYGQNYLDAINPKTGRIHTVFRQLGASSGRMTCGSTKSNKDLAKYKQIPYKNCKYVQLQTLPSDHDTRASFIAGDGRLFCSCDYSALESRLGADIYQEYSMIDEFLYKSGDIHSLVAKFCFKELKNKTTEEIKKDYPHLRKKAKPIGFCFQFGGSAYAARDSLNCSLEEAQTIMDNYLNGFIGIAAFKKKGSKFVRDNGYIVINPTTGHRLHWHDWEDWKKRQDSFKGKDWASYRVRKEKDPNNFEAKEVSMHFKAASKYDRLSLNVVTQGTGIIILKEAMINFYKYILDNKLFNIVKINNLVHDEGNIDYPNTMPHISKILQECMEKAANKYCKSLPIPAVAEVGDCWIH